MQLYTAQIQSETSLDSCRHRNILHLHVTLNWANLTKTGNKVQETSHKTIELTYKVMHKTSRLDGQRHRPSRLDLQMPIPGHGKKQQFKPRELISAVERYKANSNGTGGSYVIINISSIHWMQAVHTRNGTFGSMSGQHVAYCMHNTMYKEKIIIIYGQYLGKKFWQQWSRKSQHTRHTRRQNKYKELAKQAAAMKAPR